LSETKKIGLGLVRRGLGLGLAHSGLGLGLGRGLGLAGLMLCCETWSCS